MPEIIKIVMLHSRKQSRRLDEIVQGIHIRLLLIREISLQPALCTCPNQTLLSLNGGNRCDRTNQAAMPLQP